MHDIIEGLKLALTILDEHESIFGENMDSRHIRIKINEKIEKLEEQLFEEMEKQK